MECKRKRKRPLSADNESPSLVFTDMVGCSDEEQDHCDIPDALVQSPCASTYKKTVLQPPASAMFVSQTLTSQVTMPDGPSCTESSADATTELLSSTYGIDRDQEFSRDEKMLNEFTKLHPMTRYPALPYRNTWACTRPDLSVSVHTVSRPPQTRHSSL